MAGIELVKCYQCGSTLFAKTADCVIFCPHCDTAQFWDQGPGYLICEAGAFSMGKKGERVYLPFWSIEVIYTINHMDSYSFLHRMLEFLSPQDNSGSIRMFIPAYQLDRSRFLDLARTMIGNPPVYAPVKVDMRVRREPCTVKSATVEKLAHFLFLTIIGDKPGTLRELDYKLRFRSQKLVYMPYYLDGEDYSPGYGWPGKKD